MAGSLVVSKDLADKLDADDGRSIMRNDVQSIDGDFTRGDVLHIYDTEGTERARGLTDFTSEELSVLLGNPDRDAERLLGYKIGGDVIRAKNLITLESRHLLWDAPETVEVKAAG